MKPSDHGIFFEKKLDEMKILLSTAQQDLLLRYLDEMLQWNRVHNLTAITAPQEMIIKHLLDSLVITPFFSSQDEQIADVGSGAGLPGIPLAIFYPEKKWTLIESSEKKCCFLRHIKGLFQLAQVTILSARVERVSGVPAFDVILSRALTDLKQFVMQTKHLAKPATQWFAMKGKYPTEELQAVKNVISAITVHPLSVPTLNAERHLAILTG